MFHGSMVALVTPMYSDGRIDFDRLESLVDWHLASGTAALVILGTTGESPTILPRERSLIIRSVMDMVKGRCPVIVGTTHFSTQAAIELTQQAFSLGADAALIATPYYNRPPQEGLVQHFSAIAEAVPLPIVLYNVPTRTGCDLLPETVARLTKHTNIIGIKEATGKIERVEKILLETDGEIDCYSGDDGTATEFMLAGGKGVITVAGNVVPKLMQELCQAALEGNSAKARELDQQLRPLFNVMGVQTNPMPVKFSLQQMNKIQEGIRLPLVWLESAYQPEVKKALQALNLIPTVNSDED